MRAISFKQWIELQEKKDLDHNKKKRLKRAGRKTDIWGKAGPGSQSNVLFR